MKRSVFDGIKRAARFTGFDTWRHYMEWSKARKRGDNKAAEEASRKWNRYYTTENR